MHYSTDSFNAYITLKGGHQYYAHLIIEKTKAQISHLPKVTQRECARARIKTKQCGSKVQPMLFKLPKTLLIYSQLCLQDCLQESTSFMELSLLAPSSSYPPHLHSFSSSVCAPLLPSHTMQSPSVDLSVSTSKVESWNPVH